MNVVIINHSDNRGGAAVVSLRLVDALRNQGVDASMLVSDRYSTHPDVRQVGNKPQRRWKFLAERAGIFARNGLRRDTLFQIDTATHGTRLSRHPLVKNADAIVLAWVNQGTLSLKGIEALARLGKPLIWVMHDMWNCTGICHHAFECRRYETTCERCPLLPKSRGADLSTRTQARKRALYGNTNIHFVAVSHWLAGVCRSSSLMRDADISVIHNAFPANDFPCAPLNEPFRDIPAGKTIVVMGARRLDEPIKGFGDFIAATRHIAEKRPQLAQRLHFVLYGDLRDPSQLKQIPLPVTYLGTVGSAEKLSEIYRHSHIVLSTSLYENLPGTLIEGMASGCAAVTYGKGGQTDIVDHLTTGFIAQYRSPESIADGIEWAANNPPDRQMLHDTVQRKFDADNIAQQFIELINKIK